MIVVRKRFAWLVIVFFTLAQSVSAAAESDQSVTISFAPKTVLIERTATTQNLSLDFNIANGGQETLRITRIELSVYDRRGELQLRKFLTAGGLKHGDYEIAKILPNASTFVFNPFDTFTRDIQLTSLRFEFSIASDDRRTSFRKSVSVQPKLFVPRTELFLPLKGYLLVYDGHDLYSHHRRFNLSDSFLKEIGVTHNFTRYASDLCLVNEKGDLRRGQSDANTDWYGFGATIYAPGTGRIVRVRNDVPDNIGGKSTLTLDDFRRDPAAPAGNLIVIDHLNGEYSFLAHLKKSSVSVKEGDRVLVGQPIGQMGVSGDAYLPHVHYELRNAIDINAEPFPAYFNNLVRRLGSRRAFVRRSPLNSGEILENR
jgi:hypothetical protein